MNAILLFVVILAQGQWIPANPEVECAEAADKKLCAELLQMRDRDQLARRKQLDVDAATVDAENQKRLDEIMSSGWPTSEQVGKKASAAVWTIIQHAPLEYQKKYFDSMKNMAEAGELDKGLVATTEDRIRLREGQKQLYGTQFRHLEGGGFEFQPIEDEEHVDERRASVGLPPLAEYRKLIEQMFPRKKMAKE